MAREPEDALEEDASQHQAGRQCGACLRKGLNQSAGAERKRALLALTVERARGALWRVPIH